MIEIAFNNPILFDSIVDGDGLRSVIFFQGCLHKCKGCHNPETHAFGKGQEFTKSMQDEYIDKINNNPMLQGVTYSGGDVIFQLLDNSESAQEIIDFTKRIKETGKDLWVYTGFKLDELDHLANPYINQLLQLTDVIVDGEFIESQKTLKRKFVGSSNQRIIHLNRKEC